MVKGVAGAAPNLLFWFLVESGGNKKKRNSKFWDRNPKFSRISFARGKGRVLGGAVRSYAVNLPPPEPNGAVLNNKGD